MDRGREGSEIQVSIHDGCTAKNDYFVPSAELNVTCLRGIFSRRHRGMVSVEFSWTARDTLVVPPKRIEWESTSGLKNAGSVVFSPLVAGGVRGDDSSSSSSSTTTAGENATTAAATTTAMTLMTLCFKFVAPRAVSSIFRRSGKLRKYTEDVLLGNMLMDFRDVVLAEQRGGTGP
jgi:hypothetical protein